VRDHKTGEKLAVKVVKRSPDIVQQTYVEVAILSHIKERDREDVNGIVRIKDFTIFRSHIVPVPLVSASCSSSWRATSTNCCRATTTTV
jgi:hypothetical protein